jgi:hypothetical protein
VKRLRIDAAARAELLHETAYYEQTRPGTGRKFRIAIDDIFQRLKRASSKIGKPDEEGCRRLRVKGFPFSVVFREEASETAAYAIRPDAREPGYWLAQAKQYRKDILGSTSTTTTTITNMKRENLLQLLVALPIVLTCSPANADLKNATIALTSGNWIVLRDKDTMTDKMECTGVYRNNYGIQLTEKSLYISISGGLESITLRFGDEPVQPLRLPKEIEKRARVVVLTGTDFEQLQNVARLRYQVSTLVSGVKTGDLDLTGLAPALQSIKAGCPVQASTADSPRSDEVLTGSLCNVTLVSRMRQQGLKDNQITAICQ